MLKNLTKLPHTQENIQFCRRTRGSLYELIDHLDVAVDCEYLKEKEAESMINRIKTAF
jgi:four helix bundle protein